MNTKSLILLTILQLMPLHLTQAEATPTPLSGVALYHVFGSWKSEPFNMEISHPSESFWYGDWELGPNEVRYTLWGNANGPEVYKLSADFQYFGEDSVDPELLQAWFRALADQTLSKSSMKEFEPWLIAAQMGERSMKTIGDKVFKINLENPRWMMLEITTAQVSD